MRAQLDLFPTAAPGAPLPVDRPVAPRQGIAAFDWRQAAPWRRCPMALQRLAFAPVWRRRRRALAANIVPAPAPGDAAWRCACCGGDRLALKGHTGMTTGRLRYLICPGKKQRKRSMKP